MISINQRKDISEVFEFIKYAMNIIKKHSKSKLNVDIKADLVNAQEYKTKTNA